MFHPKRWVWLGNYYDRWERAAHLRMMMTKRGDMRIILNKKATGIRVDM